MTKSTYILPLAALGFGVIFVSGVMAVSAGAMSAGRPNPESRVNRDPRACFDPAHVRSFNTINDHKMIIVSDWNEAYELELGGACMGIDTSMRIGIRSRGLGMADVCGPMDAEIFYSDLSGNRVQSCTVTSVHHLTGDEAAPYVMKRKADRAK
ncbi:hypothetical protein AEAC466_09400 [Asticcacaulis sp. AC466]|uniref:DUF6491 family protein n=1 Tax=Asticcacaulis sp. AC466 TaxID=1282362 RepID=UPI0003C40392|nr:DUF6491 family protein [Asticcacaulis sp. AC466]ESQ84557.1 hypothetical protein AEAC466_09400 [Asticcacaulis sp. AC466]